MRSERSPWILACTLALAITAPILAKEPIKPPDASPNAAMAAAAAAKLKAEYFEEYDETANKLKQLAAAIPAEKYSWRPAEGVRSTAEAFTHVVGGQYFLLGFIGAKPPADLPNDLEKAVVEKAQVLAWLDRALADGRRAIDEATPEQREKMVDFFGKQTSGRAIFLRMLVHMNEHLGQAIAYARMNGVAPPWSRAS